MFMKSKLGASGCIFCQQENMFMKSTYPHFYSKPGMYRDIGLHIFLILCANKIIVCRYSLEPPRLYVLSKNKKKHQFFSTDFFTFSDNSICCMGMFL